MWKGNTLLVLSNGSSLYDSGRLYDHLYKTSLLLVFLLLKSSLFLLINRMNYI